MSPRFAFTGKALVSRIIKKLYLYKVFCFYYTQRRNENKPITCSSSFVHSLYSITFSCSFLPSLPFNVVFATLCWRLNPHALPVFLFIWICIATYYISLSRSCIVSLPFILVNLSPPSSRFCCNYFCPRLWCKFLLFSLFTSLSFCLPTLFYFQLPYLPQTPYAFTLLFCTFFSLCINFFPERVLYEKNDIQMNKHSPKFVSLNPMKLCEE